MPLKININPSSFWVLSFLIFFIVLFYPPFVFYHFINEGVRITFFAIILIILFIYHGVIYFHKNNFIKILFLWFCLTFYFISSILINGWEGAKTSIGYSMILMFALLLYNIVQSKIKLQFFKNMFNIYVQFFFIVPIFCICNFLFNIITPSINILTPFFSDFVYNYDASFFGLSISKYISGMNVSRNFFFFIEPVFLAFFYLLNIFVISSFVPKHSQLFKKLNIIGGILTTSFFFFIGYIIIRFIKFSLLYKSISILGIILLALILKDSFFDLLNSTSYDSRFLRYDFGIQIIKNYSIEKLFFGTGYLFDHGVDKGISAGLLTSFIEGGLIGLFIPFILALFICEGNKVLISIVLMSLLLFEPFKFPFFWFVIVLAGNLPKYSSTKIMNININ
jgi:hypothetical protein